MIRGGANQRGFIPKPNLNLKSARGAKYREYGNERIIGEAVMKKKKKGKGGRNKETRKSLGEKRKVVKEENWRYWI